MNLETFFLSLMLLPSCQLQLRSVTATLGQYLDYTGAITLLSLTLVSDKLES